MLKLLIILGLLTAHPVDSLVNLFDRAGGREKAVAANAVFARLDEDGVTDSLMVFGKGTHPDTLSVHVWYWAGEAKMVENDFGAAIPYFEKAGALAEKGKNLSLTSDCYAELAYCQTREGNLVQAVDACEKAIDADTRLGDKSRLAVSVNTMAYIYHMARRNEDAEKYIREALSLAKELNDTSKIAVRHGTLSDILMSMGRFDEALNNAREAFRLDSATNNVPKMAVRKVQIAAALFPSGQYDKAKSLLLEALPVLEQTGNLASLGICCNQLGDIACKQEAWDEAAKWFGTAVKIYSFTGEKMNESHAHYGMYQALRHSDPAAAALHLEKYAYLNDDIYNEDVSRMTSEYNARYENTQLQNKNKLLKMRNLYLGLSSLLLIVILALAFALYAWRSKAKQSEQEQRYALLRERFSHLEKEIERESSELGYREDQPLSKPAGEWLDKVHAAMQELLAEGKLDVTSLADKLCVSSRQLARKFNQTMGYSTQDYILRYRIDYACRLFDETDKNITEVARECGIDDIAYFSRFFRKMTGVSPSEYRKRKA